MRDESPDDSRQGTDALQLKHGANTVQIQLDKCRQQVLESPLLYEGISPSLLPAVGLLCFMIESHCLDVFRFVLVLLGRLRTGYVQEMGIHDAKAVQELEDRARVDHGAPGLLCVLSCTEELEPFEVLNDALVLGQLVDETPD